MLLSEFKKLERINSDKSINGKFPFKTTIAKQDKRLEFT